MAGDFPNAARVAMSRSRPGLPTREQELELHQRLLAGDPVATSDLADAYIEHLMHWISERHPRPGGPAVRLCGGRSFST